MGQGCNSCNTSYFQKLTPDTGVKYTGPAIPSLGICTGDTLSEVEAVILQKILDFSTGIGIDVSGLDLTGCACFTQNQDCCGNTCTDLICVLQAYADCLCQMYTDLQIIKTKVTEMYDGPYDVDCLNINSSGAITSASKLPAILQELIDEFCALYSQVQDIQTIIDNLVNTINTSIGNFLRNAISSCQGSSTVAITGTGASTQIAFKGGVPIGTLLPYAGPTAGKFDSSGLGLANTDACGYALADGRNNTINMMGQTPVGLTNMGGSLPSNATGLSIVSVGQQIGAREVTLTGPQSGSGAHTHTLNENGGHDHALFANSRQLPRAGVGNNYADLTGALGANTGAVNPFVNAVNGSNPNAPITAYISRSLTGITVNANAGIAASQAHNNMQPSTGVLWIQRIA